VLTDTTRAVSDGTGPTTKPKYTTGENQITKKVCGFHNIF